MDEILLNKAATIERCLKRIREEYIGSEPELATNFSKQDSILLNLQRACEATVDMASRALKLKRLGIPQSSRDVFHLLAEAKIIDSKLKGKMQAMVGFRNTAVHAYQSLNLEIVRSIIEKHLEDFIEFSKTLLKKI